jgi:hypothetical protein
MVLEPHDHPHIKHERAAAPQPRQIMVLHIDLFRIR